MIPLFPSWAQSQLIFIYCQQPQVIQMICSRCHAGPSQHQYIRTITHQIWINKSKYVLMLTLSTSCKYQSELQEINYLNKICCKSDTCFLRYSVGLLQQRFPSIQQQAPLRELQKQCILQAAMHPVIFRYSQQNIGVSNNRKYICAF